MKVDFHCHTTASDGALSPQQIIDLAVQYQVDTLAITDHDTTAGFSTAQTAAEQAGVKLISGVEASCDWQGHTIHIVGLNFDVAHAQLQHGLARTRELRWHRALQMITNLDARYNFNVVNLREKIDVLVGDGVVGRGHFAQLLIEEGLVNNAQQAFDRYLKKGRIGYVASEWPPLNDVVQWIVAAGGVAVIAHPDTYKFTNNKLNKLITDFKQAGGQAIEVVNQSQFNANISRMAERAVRHGLYGSMGSDFHRPEHTWRGLGWLAAMPEQVKPVWELF
ncbi:PHP domain-containing protein [Thiomicrorhabdus aquaedulcis]|uniref:PHP domain-containing protein n=1 Tax=Thiomicrorhabdus aquaedulcis TaxID=2211106 RepID=UPI000FD99CE2|nr:PHP domain-containing protein [Thiomicrorhabdus aquaedulcis]